MRLIMLAAIAAVSMVGQDAKVAPAPAKAMEAKTERALEESESLKIRLSQQKIKNLRADFKIDEFSKQVDPIVNEQRMIFAAACRSVGVPEDKIFAEPSQCEFNTGYGPDDKPIVGPDGKPIPAHVKWLKPQEASEPKK